MIQWEYHLLYLSSNESLKTLDSLNDVGKRGWELVAVVSCTETLYHSNYIFKRPKPTPTTDG